MCESEDGGVSGGVRQHEKILEVLLLDRTRTTIKKAHNILWMTGSYGGHKLKDEIRIEDVTGENTKLIQPRIAKSKEEQKARTRDKAEVFTPKGIVYDMCQQVDWATGHWPVTREKWQDYVSEKRLEITCGEAPFIVGRYNAVNGKKVLKLSERVGFLDRKLQVVTQFCQSRKEWLDWALKAFQCSYGYEWQGDNLLLARENLFYTFVDYWNDHFPDDMIRLEEKIDCEKMEILLRVAEVISWNLFQMDGLRYVVPMSCKHTEEVVNEVPGLLKMLGEKDVIKKRVCEGCLKGNPKLHNGKAVKIMDWEKGKPVKFWEVIQRG